ncbi:MAG: Rne/Rng family ribonuclease [Rhodospirillales bacterium]|nr:Rne/Rng family ribonuclease [Rhodospirillales bacterium]
MIKEDEILIEVRPGRTRTALLREGRLIELIVEDEHCRSLVGNIYLGRVEKVIGSLNAAFIDLGLDRSGFLALAEARPVGTKGSTNETMSSYLCEGDKVVVQILRDAFEDKGPKLTTRLALGSGSLVLTPGDPAIRISKRIDDPQRRNRLQTMLAELAGPDEGFVVRTAAQEVSDDVIARDIADLRENLLTLQAAAETSTAPALLQAEADAITRALRQTASRVVVDDTAAYLKARAVLEIQAPDQLQRLILHQGGKPLLGEEQLIEDLEQALSGDVLLPSGGSIIFSETPALIAIDVNVAGTTGGGREQVALKTNLEAACEIARQIRLRNLSGLLVIDFVSMKNKNNGSKLLDALRAAVAADPQQVFVGGFTRFGLLEMTRKRARPSLARILGGPCPLCGGSGNGLSPETIAYDALDRLAQEAAWQPSRGLGLIVGQRLADTLAGSLKSALRAVEERLGRKVEITLEAKRGDAEFEIVRTPQNTQEQS